MALSIQGKLKASGEIQRLGENGSFLKRLFWLDLSSNGYTNMAEFQLTHDSVYLVDELSPGAEIEVKFRISGRKSQYTAKDGSEKVGFFQHLQAYELVKIDRNPVGKQNTTSTYETPPMPTPPPGDDDLPF